MFVENIRQRLPIKAAHNQARAAIIIPCLSFKFLSLDDTLLKKISNCNGEGAEGKKYY